MALLPEPSFLQIACVPIGQARIIAQENIEGQCTHANTAKCTTNHGEQKVIT